MRSSLLHLVSVTVLPAPLEELRTGQGQSCASSFLSSRFRTGSNPQVVLNRRSEHYPKDAGPFINSKLQISLVARIGLRRTI